MPDNLIVRYLLIVVVRDVVERIEHRLGQVVEIDRATVLDLVGVYHNPHVTIKHTDARIFGFPACFLTVRFRTIGDARPDDVRAVLSNFTRTVVLFVSIVTGWD